MAEKMGYECKLYLGAAGTSQGEASKELTNIMEEPQILMSRSEVDRTTRANSGWKGKRAGLGEWGVTFRMKYDNADTNQSLLQTSFLSNVSIGCSVLDGSISGGGKGFKGAVWVQQFQRNEGLDNIVNIDVTLVGDGPATAV